MSEQQSSKQAHLVVGIEVFDYKHFNGQDPQRPRPSTRIKAAMTLPDGFRTIVEFYIDGHHHFQTPYWDFGLRVGSDWKNRLSLDVVGWKAGKPPVR